MGTSIALNGETLTFASLVAVARGSQPVHLDDDARERMTRTYEWVGRAARGELLNPRGESVPIYGINTGFGSLARLRIPEEQASKLSWNLMMSHAAGVGDLVPEEVVRAMMLLRANALAKGVSGCRPSLVETLAGMLNAGVTPEVPEQGSCGSSGDLAPLAHLALVLFQGPDDEDVTHSGWASFAGDRLPGAIAMERAGLQRLSPGPKDGLAITNGAQLTTALAALAAWDASELVVLAEIAAAMSWEAIKGVTRALDPRIQALRPYRGAQDCAANLRTLLNGSRIVDSIHAKVQDAYAIRCTPQIMGASRDGMRFAAQQIAIELNAATDNPLILADEAGLNKAYSAGMFHGEPVGMAADHLKVAICEVGALSERRIFRLTTGNLSSRLPPLLRDPEQPDFGMMVPHATAASLVSANRALAWPSSVDSIPTCEDQEDIVAMSTTAARHARRAVANATQIVCIELISAFTALTHRLDEHSIEDLGTGTKAAYRAIADVMEGAGETPSEAIEAVRDLVTSGAFTRAVESQSGPLLRPVEIA